LLKILIYPLSLLPLKLIKLLLFPLKLILQYVLKYRDKVITKNLKIAFPDASEEFYKKVKSDFYYNLFSIICESIKSFTISVKNANRRIPMFNAEVMNKYADKNIETTMVFGHFNNWEWTIFSGLDLMRVSRACLYQPLKNKKIDSWIKQNRSRVGGILISTKKVKEFYETNKDLVSVAYIADQSPARNGTGVWVDFFNTKTFFTLGFATTAKKRNTPVIFVDIQRVKDGYYELSFEDLIPNPSDFTIKEMVQIFATRLEKQIKENPGNWLWSHNRWKQQYKPEIEA